jgi:hypothetical protein
MHATITGLMRENERLRGVVIWAMEDEDSDILGSMWEQEARAALKSGGGK